MYINYLLNSIIQHSDCQQVSCIQLTPDATVHANAYGQMSNIRKLDMSGCQRLDDSG